MPASRAVTMTVNDVPAVAEDGPDTVKCVAAPMVLVIEKFTVARPEAVAATLYPPSARFAVNDPADAMPEALVGTVIAFVELLNVPDAPEVGAVNVTLTPLTGFPAASFTVTESAVANAVLMAADCGEVPEPAVMPYGTCTTGKDTVLLVAEEAAPPPEAVAALVTVGLGALLGTATVISISLKDAPPATACVLVQVIELFPEQLQPVPLTEKVVKPVGSVSVTVVVPEVVLDAPAVFDTVTVSVPPDCPCVNVPLWPSVTLKVGAVAICMLSAVLRPVGVAKLPGAPSDTSVGLLPPVAVPETFKLRTSVP